MDILSFELGKKLGGGGQPSPAPSSGYVEEGLLMIVENPIDDNRARADISGLNKEISAITLEIVVTCISNLSEWYDIIATNVHHISSQVDNNVPASSDYGFVCWINNDSSSNLYVYPENIKLNKQYTLSLVITTETISFYIDGALVGSLTGNYANRTITSLVATNDSSNNKRLWRNARWYTRALTAAEIASNYAVDVAKYSGNG